MATTTKKTSTKTTAKTTVKENKNISEDVIKETETVVEPTTNEVTETVAETVKEAVIEAVKEVVKAIEPTTETISQSMADIIDVISDYDNGVNAIGYSYYYYASTMYTSDTMKLLSVNGIEPSYENIQTGLYDIQSTIIINEVWDHILGLFLHFIKCKMIYVY